MRLLLRDWPSWPRWPVDWGMCLPAYIHEELLEWGQEQAIKKKYNCTHLHVSTNGDVVLLSFFLFFLLSLSPPKILCVFLSEGDWGGGAHLPQSGRQTAACVDAKRCTHIWPSCLNEYTHVHKNWVFRRCLVRAERRFLPRSRRGSPVPATCRCLCTEIHGYGN